jgi:molybdenum cofactor cytidylyltransferase
MPPERIAGVVLAAGLSSRMGRNKVLLELWGRTVVRRAVESAVEAGLSPVLVVVGHERERVEAELRNLPCTPVLNADYASGINTSLRAGIAAVPDDCAGAVMLLADMPLVTSRMLRALCDTFRAGKAPLVVSTYEGVLAPPMLYARPLFPELRELQGEGCGKRVVKRHRAEAAELAWPVAALTDLDLPADVDRVLTQMRTEGA